MDEIVTLAHGSGGKETENLVEQVFREHLQNPLLNRQEDGAVFEMSGKLAYTTDSFVVTPLFFRGGDIGKLAVCGTVNDLLMMGATPRYLSAGFIIEQGMPLEQLKKIAKSLGDTAREAGVIVATADTKVIEGCGGIYINTSGVGQIISGHEVGADNCRPGDVIVVSGNLGDHHACIMSHRMGIENDISSDVAPLVSPVNALFEENICIKAMRDITRGGLGTVVNELAKSSGCGCQIEDTALPVAQNTRALCEILGLDPFYMGNEGKFVAVVDEKDASRTVSILREFGNAAAVGRFVEGGQVTVKSAIGGERILPPLYGEGLPRIC